MPVERLANLGYFALRKETTPGVPVIPNVFVPIYDESFTTNLNIDEDMPIVGNKAMRWQFLGGARQHQGSIKVLAEPNTAARFFDMLLKKGTTTGADPYTHPFTLDDGNSYTIEFLKGIHAFRYFGVKARAIGVGFEDNKMVFPIELSARGAFTAREVLSVSGTGPTTVNLKTDYDPDVTKGLVVNDVVQLFRVSTGTYINGTVASIVDADTFTVSENWSAGAAGDVVSLRGLTPAYALQDPFKWTRTEFRFGATAAAALSAAHTPVEQGSEWKIIHEILPEGGPSRSGAADPAALPRGRGDAEVKVKTFFDTPEDENRFLSVAKRALVIRAFSTAVAGTDQELRITLNSIRQTEAPKPLKTGEIIYQEITFKPQYDVTDAQMISVSVINRVATI